MQSSGMLGLLAFSLALALSMAQSRFDTRRAAALQEANAIGTAWLRAHAIDHERGPAIARLLEDYIRLRIEYVRAGPDQTGLSAISQRTSDMQGVMWGHATAIVRERPDPAVAILLASLNEAFDSSAAQRWAFVDPIPAEIIWLLLAMSVLAIGAMGYQIALGRRRHPVATCMLIAMWTATITVTVNFSQPDMGEAMARRSSRVSVKWRAISRSSAGGSRCRAQRSSPSSRRRAIAYLPRFQGEPMSGAAASGVPIGRPCSFLWRPAPILSGNAA